MESAREADDRVRLGRADREGKRRATLYQSLVRCFASHWGNRYLQPLLGFASVGALPGYRVLHEGDLRTRGAGCAGDGLAPTGWVRPGIPNVPPADLRVLDRHPLELPKLLHDLLRAAAAPSHRAQCRDARGPRLLSVRSRRHALREAGDGRRRGRGRGGGFDPLPPRRSDASHHQYVVGVEQFPGALFRVQVLREQSVPEDFGRLRTGRARNARGVGRITARRGR